MATIADWLLENAKKMDTTIFSSGNWNLLKPIDVLLLRAFSPRGIFVSDNETKYLSKVNNPDLSELTNCLFCNDSEFIRRLPPDLQEFAAKLEVLMELAYKAKIRKK